MKQVAQRRKDGSVSVRDVPVPALGRGDVLVATRYSLISAGTERSKVELGEKNLLQKARARPDLVRKVVQHARTEGIRATAARTREQLEQLEPLGYSCAGIVVAVGADVRGVSPGERVACGGEWAPHAEYVSVPQNLVARVPEGVDLADAAYATVGAVALHAVRQAEAALGEHVGVIGLGLVGQLATRILRAAGCSVVGIDLDPATTSLAVAGGAEIFVGSDPALEDAVRAVSGGAGLDAVLICAASESAATLELGAHLLRDRGRLVVVGAVPVSLDRSLMYEKELELRISRSYGPGRYDREYEEHGRDLPVGYVRWTERRNMQAFVDLLGSGRLSVGELTTHRFPIDRADEAYELLSGQSDIRAFGVLIEYEAAAELPPAHPPAAARRSTGTRIGVIGAGSFARATLLPAFADAGATFAAVASAGGLTAEDVAARFGFERAASSADEIFGDESIDAVVIATRHSSHASLTARALAAGKAVFVEKPLALDDQELADVEAALRDDSLLMVGFNRRFAPLAEKLRTTFASAPDRVFTMRVNAGPLAADHWLHDPADGGGRLRGEGCHFVDLLLHLGGSRAVWAAATAVPQPSRPLDCSDSFGATVRMADGTVATLVYTGSGDPRLPKERLEAFGGGVSAVLDDFRTLEIYARGKRSLEKAKQDKGHRAEVERFVAAIQGREEAPPVESYLHATRVTLALADSIRTGEAVDIEK